MKTMNMIWVAMLLALPMVLTSCGDNDPYWYGDYDYGGDYRPNNRPDEDDDEDFCVSMAQTLAGQGIEARVLAMHTVKPLDEEAVRRCAEEIGRIITVEDHNVINGLGSAVCCVTAELGRGVVRRIGIPDCFGMSAPYTRLMEIHGITAERIVETAQALVK